MTHSIFLCLASRLINDFSTSLKGNRRKKSEEELLASLSPVQMNIIKSPHCPQEKRGQAIPGRHEGAVGGQLQ